MGLSSRALYSCLLQDLADNLPASSTSILTCEDTSGWPGASPVEVAALRLRQSLLKKFNDDEAKDAEQAAYETWAANNNRCAQWSYEPRDSIDETLWGEFKQALYRFFEYDSFPSLSRDCEMGRIGPGAAVGSKSTDMYSKLFSGPLVSTSSLLYLVYRQGATSSPTSLDAELSRSGSFGERVVTGSRLSFVPKSCDIRRSICVEPNLNIYFQLGFSSYLCDRLARKYGVLLDSQPELNRKLALQGSIDGSFATIDLASASDTISLKLCEEVLPPFVMGRLYQYRCPYTEYRGKKIELHMVSSMGNGFTFPLQTILFSCMVDAVYSCLEIGMREQGDKRFGVFGDDIIVRREAFPYILRLLHLAGFHVNPNKTFNDGLFRESCGVEYLNGYPVRGVFIKTLKTLQARYVAINRLNEWCAEHLMVLPRTIKYLLSHVRVSYVPFDSGYDSGVKVPSSLVNHHLRSTRYQSRAFYAYLPIRKRVGFDDQGMPSPLGIKLGMIYNPSGLYQTFLAGHLRDGAIGVRSEPLRYRRRLLTTPNWDSLITVGSSLSYLGRQQWETIVSINLTG